MELLKELPWTAILTAVIAVIAFLVKRLFDRSIKPFIESKGLSDAAAIAVAAAEAVYGRSNGEEKLKYALQTLSEDGWNIDSEAVVNAVRAAWQNLDLTQIAAGVKSVEKAE